MTEIQADSNRLRIIANQAAEIHAADKCCLTTAPSKSSPDYKIASVDRALDLIEILGRIAPVSLARIAGEANCTRTAAFRLLRTLATRGYAVQIGKRGLWQLGGRMIAMAQVADMQGSLAATAAPILDALSQATGEVVYLTQRNGQQHEFIAVCSPNPALPQYVAVGSRGPLHAGVGRLLLAYAPDSTQAQVLSQSLPRYTPATIIDPLRIATDLPRIRARGWLMAENEIESAAMCYVAAVRDANGHVTAALAIGGPIFRLKKIGATKILEPLRLAAADISRSLGWNIGAPHN